MKEQNKDNMHQARKHLEEEMRKHKLALITCEDGDIVERANYELWAALQMYEAHIFSITHSGLI